MFSVIRFTYYFCLIQHVDNDLKPKPVRESNAILSLKKDDGFKCQCERYYICALHLQSSHLKYVQVQNGVSANAVN